MKSPKLMTADVPKFYSISDIATLLNVNERTVRRWIGRGRLQSHRLGNLVRISDEAFNRFITEAEVPNVAAQKMAGNYQVKSVMPKRLGKTRR